MKLSVFSVFTLGFLATVMYLPKHDLLHENPLMVQSKKDSKPDVLPIPNNIRQSMTETKSKPERDGNLRINPEVILPSIPQMAQAPVATLPPAPVNNRDVNSLGLDTVLLIIAANRPEYLDKTLSYVVNFHPKRSCPIIISHDGNYPAVNQVIAKYQEEFRKSSSIPFESILFTPTPSNKRYENGYFRLADHYKFALSTIFSAKYSFQRAIILEEDLQIAPDFFEYFAALYPYLDNPANNLLAISAWNDNGLSRLVKDPAQVYRSDFFPGLGWMLTRSLWVHELSPKWPRAYWDDWLREPKNRQNRHTLRPEICRTLHFGAHGVSNAQYSEYLTEIRLNDEFIPFTTLDLSYLLEDRWNQQYLEQVKRARLVTPQTFHQVVQSDPSITEVKIMYNSLDEYSMEEDSLRRLSQWSGVMNNVKAGIPRTAYKGVISFWKDNVKVHLVSKNL